MAMTVWLHVEKKSQVSKPFMQVLVVIFSELRLNTSTATLGNFRQSLLCFRGAVLLTFPVFNIALQLQYTV